MFNPDDIIAQRILAARIGRSTRSICNWRKRGLLPAPDLLLGGREPAWFGATLNDAPAFAKPAQ